MVKTLFPLPVRCSFRRLLLWGCMWEGLFDSALLSHRNWDDAGIRDVYCPHLYKPSKPQWLFSAIAYHTQTVSAHAASCSLRFPKLIKDFEMEESWSHLKPFEQLWDELKRWGHTRPSCLAWVHDIINASVNRVRNLVENFLGNSSWECCYVSKTGLNMKKKKKMLSFRCAQPLAI